jgi:hypothetical protein
MADVNIKSENQSGGITAQNVNSTVDQFNTTGGSQPESRATRIFWWIFGVAGVLGAAAGIIALFK